MGEPKKVMIEMSSSHVPTRAAMGIGPGAEIAAEAAVPEKVPGISVDSTFAGVPLAKQVAREVGADPFDVGAAFSLDASPEASTYLVRGEMDSDAITEKGYSAKPPAGVVGIYSDPQIEVCLICPGSPPLGTDADVARLLCVPALAHKGMDGKGVMVAIVDTGFNLPYLHAHGKNPNFDAAKSWVPRPGLTPGQLPVNHGTMCAYDTLIADRKSVV